MFAFKKLLPPVTLSFVAANPAALDASGSPFEPVSAGKVEEAMIVAMLAFFGLSSVIALLAA